jgi:hypothetical protein
VNGLQNVAIPCHSVLPPRFPDHREPFHIGEMFDAKLEIFPARAYFPALEAGHVEQQAQFSVLAHESLDLGYKLLKI